MLAPGEEYHDLATLVREKARRNGARPALRFEPRTLSYAELDEATDRVASGLASRGFGKGDRIAALLFNTPEFVETWFGASKIGATLVPLNTGLKGEILTYELDDSRPKGIVVDARLWETYAPARPPTWTALEWVAGSSDRAPPDGKTPRFEELRSRASPPDVAPPKGADPAAILYTSGTTGPPKGAVIPHEQMIRTAREVGERSRLSEGAILFTALPLFHCNAQEMTTLPALLNDLTAAFDERFHATTYWETAKRLGATHVSLLISMINVLFKQPEKATDRGHGVRVALTAGATREVWPEFERRFGLSIIELYGMTECGCTTLMNPPDRIRVGSIGTPLGFVDADVVDDDDRTVPPDTRGELVVRPTAPFTMFSGYINKPEETVRSWQNLWFHTGDYVRRDSDGYYYFIDRKKDVIRRRGENLAPYDVESALNRHPSVFETVVVGVPSPLGEEDVKAYVQLKPGHAATARELFEFCVEKLPFFMVPMFIEFLPEVPKTANQKAQRFLLRQRTGGVVHDREKLGLKVKR
ncbi:MAG TPA: AMP-binding protein, partial [Thermoplasmata archaeon]|nr:AMP-binding protein [Thermoplasmata archaeon]